MDELIVVNPVFDSHGAQKENIFIAQDQDGEALGSVRIYPFFDEAVEPDHPHNLYLHFHPEGDKYLSDPIKDLLEHALQRSVEIKAEERQPKTRVYGCFLKHQRKEIDYFLERGFLHDEGMLILERIESAALTAGKLPAGFTIQTWRIDNEEEQRQFLMAHRQVFARHAYNAQRLGELKAKPGWENFTAFCESEIIGNIMVFLKPEDEGIGYMEDLFVIKRWRRNGIGRCLLSTALGHFYNQGIHRVQLEFWSANKPVLALYQTYGFSSIDETEIAVGRYV